jgi:hypothetical protein
VPYDEIVADIAEKAPCLPDGLIARTIGGGMSRSAMVKPRRDFLRDSRGKSGP